MKEIKSIIKFYHSYKKTNEKCAIAQVVRVEASSYRREGARMLVFESGIFEGGISGGCLEGDALKRSQMAILKEKPSIVTYDTSKDDENQIGIGLGCNGVIDVLISPISPKNNPLILLEKCLQVRQSHIIITIVASNGREDNIALGETYYYDTKLKSIEDCANQELKKLLLEDINVVVSNKKSKIFSYKLSDCQVKAFIEVIPPQIHLAIFGDNYDVYPIIDLAKVLDWDISLVGNLQKLKKEKLAFVSNLYLKDDSDFPEIDARTAVLLMAHDYKTDLNNLIKVLKTTSPYIASLGPRSRFKKMEDELQDMDKPLTKSDLKRIYAPCGLEIGAATPEEIATSIFAEILSVFSFKKGGMLREKIGPIHDRV